mmetsp:Transcript_35764/g.92868  ORF Transcript_35764/g.92868 Transcript_35764/m.92868 type:complete len:489 (+) Transcript_35764:408-1874(+)
MENTVPYAHSATALFGLAVLVRFGVGLHGYSGQGRPPMYGDYEAQRHWMEITLHTPVAEWYVDTNANNLSYWGLDYPPLSAYQSYAYGKVLQAWEPDAFALTASRGYESPTSKMLMRGSVIFSDFVFTFPAVWAVIASFYPGAPARERLCTVVAMLLQPAAVLIDHGHFQYNNIGLGLTAMAAAAIASNRDCVGSALFCMALNHKQMTMYFAPAFFAHLLGKCLQQEGLLNKLVGVAKLGAVVIVTFAVIWLPFLTSPDLVLKVLQRLAPVQRGLFEDYVANFWCVTHTAIKWKAVFTKAQLWQMCTGATLLAFLPCVAQQIWRPSRYGFLLCLANSAIAFFMFSYQVHEKSCLLFLLPVTMLAGREPYVAASLPAVAAFSMYPLLRKDCVAPAYFGANMLYVCLQSPWLFPLSRVLRVISSASIVTMAAVHAADAFLDPPKRYPYLFDLVFVSFSFICFLAAYVYLNYQQVFGRNASNKHKAATKSD